MGGYAVAANATHLFISVRMGNEGGGLKDPETWPPAGRDWIGVYAGRSRTFAKPPRFPAAREARAIRSRVPSWWSMKSWSTRNRSIRRAEHHGLVGIRSTAVGSCPYDGTIKIFDAVTMQRLAARPVERAVSLAWEHRLAVGAAGRRCQPSAADDRLRSAGHSPATAHHLRRADPACSLLFTAPDGRPPGGLMMGRGNKVPLIFDQLASAPAPTARCGWAKKVGFYVGRPGEFGTLQIQPSAGHRV